jgi:hypothetical protein
VPYLKHFRATQDNQAPIYVTRKSRGQLIYYCVADCAKICRHLTTVSVVSRLSEGHFGTHIAVTPEGFSLERALGYCKPSILEGVAAFVLFHAAVTAADMASTIARIVWVTDD